MRLISWSVALALSLLSTVAAEADTGCAAPVDACARPVAGGLALIEPQRSTTIVIDPADDAGVRRAAGDLAGDLRAVGGGRVVLAQDLAGGATVIAGTLGSSAIVDALVRAGRIDVTGLRGAWEGYVLQVVDRPAPGIDRALVIVGADRRGAIYGLYEVSAKAGVSPWTWWADVPVPHRASLYLTPGRVADRPVVRYRGIFLNDEEPALGGWARARFGGLNRPFYERVFTLLLRSRANFLWPAMWGKSLWQDDPATAPLAREMGVILGTSHHEPMGRAQVDWARAGGGAWDYTRNADALRRFWRDGIVRRGDAEDLVTIGMRGDGDEPMTEGTAIDLLQRIVADQRRIIADATGRAPERTPQVWALYKEVQDYYDKGMRVPDDVTLLFSDDNWGNIRRLPPPGERRAGGYGVYYHFDYVGDPRNYKWLDTNAIPRVWQQMAMARSFGADRLWIVNVGDLKPMEYATSFFLAMAWNPDRMDQAAMKAFPARWAGEQFGAARGAGIGRLLVRYGQLASRRKPELIDADTYDLTEWPQVLGAWSRLEADARRAGAGIPAAARSAWYQLVLHRIAAMANLHRLYAAVAANRAAARAGDAAGALRQAKAARGFFAEDGAIRRRYEQLSGGKWAGMMAQTHIGYNGWQQPEVDAMPALATPAAPLPAPPHRPAAPAFSLAADAGRATDGRGIRWSRVADFTADGAAMIAVPASVPAIERPGGADPHIDYAVTLPAARQLAVSVTAAPGLDVRGTGRHRVALSIDGGAPVIVDLLAGETPARWAQAVGDNRRIATAILPAVTRGRHRLTLWLVDPQVVVERIGIDPR